MWFIPKREQQDSEVYALIRQSRTRQTPVLGIKQSETSTAKMVFANIVFQRVGRDNKVKN